MNPEFINYNKALNKTDQEICNALLEIISENMPEAENKIWHRHPVWFLDGNPVVGYSKLKNSIRLMFWSGADFEEEDLKPGSGKFKDASIDFTSSEQIKPSKLKRWLRKAKTIQWDYKNVVKRKGVLVRLK
ncbi:MAG: DUF1801 domain-containing protein [Bacteroidia bacterium]|nr:DUF1801 domain-containing protein [Bacteroidia bacterium]